MELLRKILLFATLYHTIHAKSKPSKAVLLSQISTLTLRSDQQTSSRRVSAVLQLKCTGGNALGLYDVDVMRCRNVGADYDVNDVQWTCNAQLPPEFRLGSTDVVCEGYDSSEDPYVLKGSCGVEYKLVLTEAGIAKYGERKSTGSVAPSAHITVAGSLMFWGIIAFIAFVFAKGIWDNRRGLPRAAPRRPVNRPGAGWGGGGGGDDDDDDNDPPPPYSKRPPSDKPKQSSSRSSRNAGSGWAGHAASAAAGSAAGYWLGSRNSTRRDDPQVGSSRSASRSESTPSTSRYESTGFGGSTRR